MLLYNIWNKKNEGAIITRYYESLVNIETLDIDNGITYLVQTNSEREYLDNRRAVAQTNLQKLKAAGQEFTYANVAEVMSKSPNHNSLTVYSTVQSPFNNGFLSSVYWKK